MPLGINSLELQSFFKLPEQFSGKSIQRSYNFYVTFWDNPLKRIRGENLKLGPMPILRSYHVQSVTIPHYKFDRKVMLYGQVPRTFPLLNFEGFELSMVLEEDELGSIAYFIQWLQRTIINRDGLYNAPLDSKVAFISVEIQDKNGIPVVYYIFHDCYFLNVSDITYDYATNESIKYNLTFGCDRVSTEFLKYNPIGLAVNGVFNSLNSKNINKNNDLR